MKRCYVCLDTVNRHSVCWQGGDLRILPKSFECRGAEEVWIMPFLSTVSTSDGSSPVQMFEVAVKHDILRGSLRILQEPGSSALRVSLDTQID